VLFPAFASVDIADLRRAFLTSMHFTSMIALPVAALLIALSDPLVLVAFGDQWEDAVPVMQIFTLYALTSPITLVCGTALKARGRAGLLLKVSLFQVALVIPSVAIVVPHGIMAVAICHAAAAAVILLVQLVIAMRMLDTNPASVIRTLAAPVAAALLVGAIAAAVNAAIDSAVGAILVAGVVGGAAGIALLWAVDRTALQSLIGAVVPRLARASADPIPSPPSPAPTPPTP
jgi:PST family polysaccharide transporter